MENDIIPSVFNLQEFGFSIVERKNGRIVQKRKKSKPLSAKPLLIPLPKIKACKMAVPRITKSKLKFNPPCQPQMEIRTKEQLTPRQLELYRRLFYFYNGTNYIAEYLIPLQNKPANTSLSLRTVNYFVTTYAHLQTVQYKVKGVTVDVATSYDNELLQHTKKLFDPFRRHWRIKWELPTGEQFVTTLAQLNFFRWAIDFQILKWADEHRSQIELHMKQHHRSLLISSPIKIESASPVHETIPCDTRMD